MYDKLELSRLQRGLSLALDLRRKEMNVTLVWLCGLLLM